MRANYSRPSLLRHHSFQCCFSFVNACEILEEKKIKIKISVTVLHAGGILHAAQDASVPHLFASTFIMERCKKNYSDVSR